MRRLVVVWMILLLGGAGAGARAGAQVPSGTAEGPRLAIHLIATYEYPECFEMGPLSIDQIQSELGREDLAASKGFGYACFLAYGTDGLTGVEFKLGGIEKIKGFKAGRLEWCSAGALSMGDFLHEGGIAAFPCLERPEGDPFIVLGYLPFEYRGDGNVHLTLEPSSYSKPDSPKIYVLDCSTTFGEHEVAGVSGGLIEGAGANPEAMIGGLVKGSMMWSMDGQGTQAINQFPPGNQPAGQTQVEMSFPRVPIDGFLAGVDRQGRMIEQLQDEGARWLLAERNPDRVLRMTQGTVKGRGGGTPWDLTLMSMTGSVIWEKKTAGQRAWVSPDGSRVAWQELGHAGRVEKRLHLWREGAGEIDLPGIGARDVRFLENGTLVGWGRVLAGAVLDAQPGEWGVFSLGPDGTLDWFAGTPEGDVGALAASSGGIALARVQEGEGLAVDAWDLSGDARFSGSLVSGKMTDARGGRVEASYSADGGRIIAAWAPRGGTAYILAGLDGETGTMLWRRDPNQDIVEDGMSPARMLFSGDDSRFGLFSFRATHPPAFGVCIYDRDGTLVWRRRKVNCAGASQDLMLSESGDQLLIIGCGRAYVYQLYPATAP